MKITSKKSPYKNPTKKNHGPRGVHRKPTDDFSFTEADERMYDFFHNHGFGNYPHEKRHQLVRFYMLLMAEQKKQNITRLMNIRDVAIKHYIDCLMVPKLTKLKFPLLDIGTGAGFPGIPLKIDIPDKPMLLSEGVQKRVEFLKKAREELKLENLDIIGRNITPTFVYPIQGAITRAVEDISMTLEGVINALQLYGEVYFMKGPNVDSEIPKALDAWGEFYELKADIPYELPKTSHQRRLIVFRKIRHPEAVSLNKVIESDE